MRHKDAVVSRALPKLNTTEIDISSKKNADLRRRRRRRIMGGKKISGARKRKKKKEKEEAAKEAVADMERLKLGPTPLWTGLVLHHKDVFVSHVLPKLNETDRYFFKKVNRESLDVLAYAGVNVSELCYYVDECSSISTLELVWNKMPWAEKDNDGDVADQAWFCAGVAETNKLEFLKWAREVKHCEWDEETITAAAFEGNLEMLKYCFSNDCPCDEEQACGLAAEEGHLDCLRFLFDKVKPSRRTEKKTALRAASEYAGHMHILRYFVEERKISDERKGECVATAARDGQLDCIKYLVEEAKAPRNHFDHIAFARNPKCENYLLEKGCPEPTDEEYAEFVEDQQRDSEEENSD
ncbi:unnamed protein product [Bathycoccus prasinos]